MSDEQMINELMFSPWTGREIKTGNQRLLKLAEFLKTVPRKRFNYTTWVGSDWGGAQNLSCGTTACALGWAATMPEFRRLGLRFEFYRYADGEKSNGYVALKRADGDVEDDSLEAAANIFYLSYAQAGFLFSPLETYDGETGPDDSATPKQVARHIERFVKRREHLLKTMTMDVNA